VQKSCCRSAQATFILKHVTNPKAKRLLNAVSPGEPSPKCAACGTARLELQIDTRTTTLGQMLDKVGSLCTHETIFGLPASRISSWEPL
jgi:hypothetical protein